MVLDVQKLCTYGVLRFGLLEAEDGEVRDCLSFLRLKLREMAQCPEGEAGYSSSSDGEVEYG